MPSLSAERVEPRKETFVSIEVFSEESDDFPVLFFANDIVFSFSKREKQISLLPGLVNWRMLVG
jgi:hypothetical protein